MTTIEWTQREGSKGETWNPVTGCDRVSAGCVNCYAADVAKRFWGDRPFSDVQFHPERLEQPLRWRKPRMVFVDSMGDLFHETVTDEQLDRVFAAMYFAKRHIFQVLTKRPERMAKYIPGLIERLKREDWGFCPEKGVGFLDGSGYMRPIEGFDFPFPNIWLGVSVENQNAGAKRVSLLRDTPAAVRFLSCEPLLENIFLANLKDIDWVIVGGESGPKARECHLPWIQSIVEQCAIAGVPCFTKQTGSNPWENDAQQGLVSSKGSDPEEWANLGYNWPRQFPKGVEAVQV